MLNIDNVNADGWRRSADGKFVATLKLSEDATNNLLKCHKITGYASESDTLAMILKIAAEVIFSGDFPDILESARKERCKS